MSDFPKDLIFDNEAREKLRTGIKTIAKAVASTFGPMGRTVLIESADQTHGLTNTKDGVTVAKSIELLDPVENLAVRIMKQAAVRTGTESGDGTSNSIVLAEAIIEAGFELIKPEMNRIEVLRALNKITTDIVKTLKKKSRKVTGRMLLDVATISANNDPKIGEIIADAYNAVGKGGLVIASKSQTEKTYSEVTKGLRIDRGWTKRQYINNHSKEECIFENCKILVCDTEIANFQDIDRIFPPFFKGEKLLLIAPCSPVMEATFVHNVLNNGLRMCNIIPPAMGYRQHELMEDIAVAVGAKCFTASSGDNLSLITPEHLGHAQKVVVSHDTTTIILDDSSDKEVINTRVAQLREYYNNEQDKVRKDFILERIASLTGGIGVIYVGGNTDTEQKELYDRVDDSICAVRSALEEGVVAGGGKALFEIQLTTNGEIEHDVAVNILWTALRSPLLQILANAGLTYDDVYKYKADLSLGYNVKTGEYGDMIKLGVIDPCKVVRCALENAVSVAVTILSTNCVITIAREPKN